MAPIRDSFAIAVGLPGSAITAPLVCHSLFPGAKLQSLVSGASGRYVLARGTISWGGP
jgi:hypothetical protein